MTVLFNESVARPVTLRVFEVAPVARNWLETSDGHDPTSNDRRFIPDCIFHM